MTYKEALDALVTAVRPVAAAADDLDDKTRDTDEIWELPAAMGITAGNLRRSNAAITRERGNDTQRSA